MPATRSFRAPDRPTLDDLAFAAGLAIFAAALAAFAGLADPRPPEVSVQVMASPGQARADDTFTGSRVDGVPIYRLPAISVQAVREVELAGVTTPDKPARSPGPFPRRDRQG